MSNLNYLIFIAPGVYSILYITFILIYNFGGKVDSNFAKSLFNVRGEANYKYPEREKMKFLIGKMLRNWTFILILSYILAYMFYKWSNPTSLVIGFISITSLEIAGCVLDAYTKKKYLNN